MTEQVETKQCMKSNVEEPTIIGGVHASEKKGGIIEIIIQHHGSTYFMNINKRDL